MGKYFESRDLEYKRELSHSLEKEVVAFLNSREGGRIFLGIDTRKELVCGVENPDQVQLQIKDRLKNNIEPSIMGLFDVVMESIENRDVIKLILASGPEKPYYLKKYGMTAKGCFIRVGSSCEPMNQETIEALFSTRVRNSIGKMISPRQNLTFEQLKIYYLERGLKLSDAFMHNLELLTLKESLTIQLICLLMIMEFRFRLPNTLIPHELI